MAKYKDADELLKRLNSCKYPAEKPTMRQATYNAAISDACRIVDAIPAVDIPRWIPVTERLPQESGEYLVTIGSMLYFSWFYKDDGVWSFRNADITAWMPLPEPYKGGEEE